MPDRSNQPPWTVVGVFDPDGTGRDFAYTVGLSALGHPELHMWARPPEGDDPGEDWKFGRRENMALLNDFAANLLQGELEVGTTLKREFDGGGATATFRFDPPVAPETLEAFQAAPDATVIPIRWSLHRAPEGQPRPVPAELAPQLRAEITTLLEPPPPAAAQLPDPWSFPSHHAAVDSTDDDDDDDGLFDVDQCFGPLTPLVRAYAARLATSDAATLARFCDNALAADSGTSPRAVLSLTMAQARPVGRSAALAAIRNATPALVRALTGEQTPTDQWRAALVDLAGGDALADPDLVDAVTHLLDHAVAALLCTVALRDVADPATTLAGLGPFAWTQGDDPFTAPEPWQASAAVLGQVTDLLGDLNEAGLRDLATAHLLAEQDDDDYDALSRHLRGVALTRGGGLPPLADVLTGTPARDALEALPEDAADPATIVRADVLVAAATVTAALSHASHIAPDQRALLTAPFDDLMPELDLVLERQARRPQPPPVRVAVDR